MLEQRVLLTVPVNPKPTGVISDLRPELSWTGHAGDVSYRVWLKNTTQPSASPITINTPDRSVQPTSDLGIGSFRFLVRSIDAAGIFSNWSNPATFSIRSPVTIDEVEQGPTVTRPEIEWNSLLGAAAYEVNLKMLSPVYQDVIRVSGITETDWSPSADLPIGRYRVYVRAFDSNGTASPWSEKFDFQVAPLPTVSGASLVTSDTTPELTWSSVEGADKYEVVLRNATTGQTIQRQFAYANSVTADSLTMGAYRWQVRAINSRGLSGGFSSMTQFTVVIAPELTNEQNEESWSANINWLNVDGATSYTVRIIELNVSEPRIFETGGIVGSSFIPTSLLRPADYQVTVRSLFGSEMSEWSVPVNFRILPPTLSDVSYGEHANQVLSLWKAESETPTPILYFIHGGGWISLDRLNLLGTVFQQTIDAGISIVSIEYRSISDAIDEGVYPPVMAPLSDAARGLQYVRSRAVEWGLDKTRVVASGTSAGGFSALWLAYHDEMADPNNSDPVARESTRVSGVAVDRAQTTLDPLLMREWIPNIGYGSHAFGIMTGIGDDPPIAKPDMFKMNMTEFLNQRASLLSLINEVSPYSLVSEDDPPTYLTYAVAPSVGVRQSITTHSANFGAKLKERIHEVGGECQLRCPEGDPSAPLTMAAAIVGMLSTSQ